jgi:hypothetical protein
MKLILIILYTFVPVPFLLYTGSFLAKGNKSSIKKMLSKKKIGKNMEYW